MPSIETASADAATADPPADGGASPWGLPASGKAPDDPFSPSATLDEGERGLLLDLAWESIRHGLAKGTPARAALGALPARLREPGAAFVTLHRHARLRGCIGHLEAVRPLAEDVADNAFAAAFRDPRFAPLGESELQGLALSVSVLTPPEPLGFRDEADLLSRLRPGVDGLILSDRGARGTFLPSVWETLPEPERFLAELKRKAGFPPDYWSPTLRLSRYRTETFGG